MKYSVCNELFGTVPFDRACAILSGAGFQGVEIAPFTLFGDFSQGAIDRGVKEASAALKSEGLAFAGMHWLMTKPEGLHLASADEALRRRSTAHLARLLEAAGELGGGALVLGSPKQRKSLPGQDRTRTTELLGASLAELAALAAACKSEILIEQLSPDQTDVINTMAEAARLIDSVGQPSISGMFDFHNSVSETESWETLISKYYPYIKHVHANEIDGRAPGTGNSDYLPAFKTLISRGYDRWVSIEIFEIASDPETMLRASMKLFRDLEEGVHTGREK